MDATPRLRVLVGPLDEVVRQALITTWSRYLLLEESTATGGRLLREAIARKADAVVADRDDIALVAGNAPAKVLLVGVSAASYEVLLCRSADIWSLRNPSPDEIGYAIIVRTAP